MKIDFGKWINGLLLGLLLLNSSCNLFKRPQEVPFCEEAIPVEDSDAEPLCFEPEEFQSLLGKLLETQGILLHDAIMCALHDENAEEGRESNKTELYANAHEIAILFAPIYGSRVAERIEKLLRRHVRLADAYIQAIKCRNFAFAKQILKEEYANGHLLVEFLNIMNPFFAYEPEKYMFDEHVTLESDLTMAYFNGDFERAEELKSRSLNQLQEMSTHIAEAIEEQMADHEQADSLLLTEIEEDPGEQMEKLEENCNQTEDKCEMEDNCDN